MNISSKKSDKDADIALVRRAKRGDYRAFDLLVLKYQSKVISLARKFIQDTHLAEDIAQEAFVKAYKSLKSFREESAFYTWLYRITVNTAKNYLKSKKRRKEYSESEVFTAIDIENLANNLRDVILESLSNLPEDIRTAVSLREFEGLTYEEISKVIGCPIGTVRSRIFRGREEIQEKIAPLLSHIKKELINKEKRI